LRSENGESENGCTGAIGKNRLLWVKLTSH
jgi:hypothetical protein